MVSFCLMDPILQILLVKIVTYLLFLRFQHVQIDDCWNYKRIRCLSKSVSKNDTFLFLNYKHCCGRTNSFGGGPALKYSNFEKWITLTIFWCSDDSHNSLKTLTEMIRTPKYIKGCSFLEIGIFQSGTLPTNLYDHNSICNSEIKTFYISRHF